MEISKAKIKLVASLRERKHRRAEGLFAVEGTKSVLDTICEFNPRMLVATSPWLEKYAPELPADIIFTAKSAQLNSMSALITAPEVIAVYDIPPMRVPEADELRGNLTLILDGIQDPGNLGTIVRCADWFGVKYIVASPNTVDIYNPKAIQATMGAFVRVKVSYASLPEFLKLHPHIPLYCTMLDGEDIYSSSLPQESFVAMGNEGSGLSPEVVQAATHRLFIPPYPKDAQTVESLNVAMATAIVLSQFRRNG